MRLEYEIRRKKAGIAGPFFVASLVGAPHGREFLRSRDLIEELAPMGRSYGPDPVASIVAWLRRHPGDQGS